MFAEQNSCGPPQLLPASPVGPSAHHWPHQPHHPSRNTTSASQNLCRGTRRRRSIPRPELEPKAIAPNRSVLCRTRREGKDERGKARNTRKRGKARKGTGRRARPLLAWARRAKQAGSSPLTLLLQGKQGSGGLAIMARSMDSFGVLASPWALLEE